MWIWWIVSLIVLIACVIFVYRVIVSSNDFLPPDKKLFPRYKKTVASDNASTAQQDAIKAFKNKTQSTGENTSFYEIQFSKFQKRLKALEDQYSTQQQQVNIQPKEDEEDWKEMYYEENEAKQKIENELDETRQKIEEAEYKLISIEENNHKWIALQSDYDARLNDLQSLQNNIDLMQRQLEAAAEREKELEEILLSEITIKKKYSQLESDYTSLQSETEDLRRQVVEMSSKERHLEVRLARLNELESKLALHEEEKAKMISEMESMVRENKMF